MKSEIFLKDYTSPLFSIETIHLCVDIYSDYTEVKNTSTFRSKNHSSSLLCLDGNNLDLQSILLNGTTPSYEQTNTQLIIKNVPESFTLETVVRIKPHENTQLMGLYQSDGILCTQCEPEGFRNITYHLDRPDVMSLYTCSISAEKDTYPTLLSNGNSLSSPQVQNNNPNRHTITWQDPFKKPSYLFALVAGDLICTSDSFTTQSGRTIPLQIYTERGTGNETRVSHAMKSLKKAMQWDEEKFGREYDLDIFMIVAVDAFNAGAMENKGLNIFNSSAILCDQRTATDRDFQWIEAVVAHEYFHNWTGNRITCRDWFQLTLKEGLTVYRDAEFSSDMGDRSLKRISDTAVIKEHQFPEDAGPMAHPIQPQSFVEIENFYTTTVYEKGSEVIRMLKTMFGETSFRKAMDYYFKTFDGQAITIHEFLESFEKTLSIDLSQFKNSWYFQAGTPKVLVKEEYDQHTESYTLHFQQKNTHPSAHTPAVIPILLGLLDKYGKEIPLSHPDLSENLFILTQEQSSITFQNIPHKPHPSLLRDFSAPVQLEYYPSQKEDIFMFQNDTDPVNRYQAGQRMATQSIHTLMHTESSETVSVSDTVIEAYYSVLSDSNISDGFVAECLTLPGLFTLVQGSDFYDFPKAYIAKKLFLSNIATALQEPLLKTYHKKQSEPYTLSQKSIGARSLKNICLAYLSESDTDTLPLIASQYETANNMTDSIRSLALLCHHNSIHTKNALFDFEQKWKDNSLVMNKWFGVQAISPLSNTLQKVKELESHPCFSLKNPNKVRALYGSFSQNFPIFHASDGSGYQYIGEKIIQLDSINEKMSSRLANAFQHYAFLSETQQQLMKTVLHNIQNTKGLSAGLTEVIQKTLQSVSKTK